MRRWAQFSRRANERFEDWSAADTPFGNFVGRDLMDLHPVLRRQRIALRLALTEIEENRPLRLGRRVLHDALVIGRERSPNLLVDQDQHPVGEWRVLATVSMTSHRCRATMKVMPA